MRHDYAVSVGMVVSLRVAEEFLGFSESERVLSALEGAGSPTSARADPREVMRLARMGKKAWYGGRWSWPSPGGSERPGSRGGSAGS